MDLFSIKNYKNNIIDDKGVYNYRNISEQHKKIKSLDLNYGLVMLISSNCFETLLFYIFFFNYKYPQIIIDYKTPEEKILEIIKRYEPKYIVLEKKKYIKNLGKIIFKFKKFFLIKTNYKNYKLSKQIGILLSTSGSTGSKKFVKLSYENIKDNTKNIIKYLNLKNKDVCITTMPFAYSYGLSIINTHFKKNCSIVLTEKSIFEKNFWEKYNQYKVTNLNGVPIFYELIKKLGFEKIVSKNLRFLTQAGGNMEKKLTGSLIKFCKNNKLRLIVMYGQTEASPRISYLNPKFLEKKISSIGKAIPGGKINIIKNEIVYYGKNIFGGYSNDKKDLHNFKENNKLRTGDIGYKDKEGFIYITGRKKRITKIYGHRFSLDEIENKVFEDLKIKIACVELNNKIKVFLKKEGDKRTVNSYLKKNLNISDKFFKLIIIQNFPLNLNKKINYKTLLKING